jgi:thiamine biosynthesis lipoprotein
MKETKILMGMPVTVEIVDDGASSHDIEDVFSYFEYIDDTFSTFKSSSEMMRINRGELERSQWSPDMKEIFDLAERTKNETDGYFDIKTPGGSFDPSGMVKGWAIGKAADILKKKGFKNFYVDAGGDIEVSGVNEKGERWIIGIRNPFNVSEIVKKITLTDGGIATSGTYERGNHIYNPKTGETADSDIVSMSVVGPNVYEADRFATAAFAMGRDGIRFIERVPGIEGYMIDRQGIATMTSGFENYVL